MSQIKTGDRVVCNISMFMAGGMIKGQVGVICKPIEGNLQGGNCYVRLDDGRVVFTLGENLELLPGIRTGFKVGDHVTIKCRKNGTGFAPGWDNPDAFYGKTGYIISLECDCHYAVHPDKNAIDWSAGGGYYGMYKAEDLELVARAEDISTAIDRLVRSTLTSSIGISTSISNLSETSFFYNTPFTKYFKKEKDMSVVDRIKKLALSSDDKLLRKYSLQNDCGEWTEEAQEVLVAMLMDERRSDLVAKAKELAAEDKADKR